MTRILAAVGLAAALLLTVAGPAAAAPATPARHHAPHHRWYVLPVPHHPWPIPRHLLGVTS